MTNKNDGKILVVEDMAIQRENLQQILELEDFVVETAANGLQALEILTRGFLPDLIICDIMMPEMDGYQLREAMRGNPAWQGIGFIFLSAKASKEDIQAGKSYGVEEYLTKPVEIPTLLQATKVSLKRLEEIREAEKSRNEELFRDLFTRVSHEMRTPLSIITSGLSLFELESATSPEIKEYLNFIVNGHDRILALVEKVKRMQDAELPSADSKPAQGLPAHLIEDIFSEIFKNHTFFGRFTAKSIDFKITLKDSDTLLRVRAQELKTISEELLENAIKFSDDSHKVRVTGRLIDNTYCLAFEDSGQGFPLEHLDDLFKPFYQHQRELREQQGMGIGLTVVKAMASKAGIKMIVENTPAKHGRFSLMIPCHV